MAGPFADLTDLRLFAVVAQHRSVSAAATAVNISQPAASRRLHAIQSRVGIRLFRFGPRGAQLTEAGQFWANEAVGILRGLDEAQSRFATTFHLRSGLNFAASQVVAEYLVPRWLSSWSQARSVPAAVVVGNSDEVVQMVSAARVDFAVVQLGTPPPPHLASVPLFADRLVLIVPRDHAWVGRGRPISAREVAETPLIQRESTSGSQLKWIEALDGAGIGMVAPILEVDSLPALKRAVAAGIGPAIVPRIAAEEDLASGQLCEIPVDGLDLEVWVTVLRLPATDLSPAARSFIGHIRDSRSPAGTSVRQFAAVQQVKRV
jgi:DNA-binding transcriptional LysR family regulator